MGKKKTTNNSKAGKREPVYLPLADLKAAHRKVVRQYMEEGKAIHTLKQAISPHDVKKKALSEQILRITTLNHIDGVYLNGVLVFTTGTGNKYPSAMELIELAEEHETRQFAERLKTLVKKHTGVKAAQVKFKKGYVPK
jgi:hypothetical protein